MIENKVKQFSARRARFSQAGHPFSRPYTHSGAAELCREIVEYFASHFTEQKPDAIAGIEALRFRFGPLLSQRLGVPFIPIRKKGKLPYQTIETFYDLEYGQASIEMHLDAVKPANACSSTTI